MSHKFSVAAFAGTLLLVLGVNQLLSVERPEPEQCRPTGSSNGSNGVTR